MEVLRAENLGLPGSFRVAASRKAVSERRESETITQGTRQATIAYDTRDRPVTFTDAMQHSVTFGYDDADRINSQTLPDGRVFGFSYDANGNVIQVVPPGRPGHLFSYTPVDLTQGYVPPAVPGTGATVYTYNKDQQLTRVDRPGGDALVLDYDSGGRLGTVTFDAGSISFGYHTTGQVQSIAAPGVGLAYTFDGPLPLTSTWSGGVTGVVGHTYTNDFTVSTESVNGAAVSFGYDDDGLLTQAGDLGAGAAPGARAADGDDAGGFERPVRLDRLRGAGALPGGAPGVGVVPGFRLAVHA